MNDGRKESAESTVTEKSGTKNQEEDGSILITTRNPEEKDMSGNGLNESNLSQEINTGRKYILDPKRRRTESELVLDENGPENMQMDGPHTTDKIVELIGSKNLKVAGSGDQTRPEL